MIDEYGLWLESFSWWLELCSRPLDYFDFFDVIDIFCSTLSACS